MNKHGKHVFGSVLSYRIQHEKPQAVDQAGYRESRVGVHRRHRVHDRRIRDAHGQPRSAAMVDAAVQRDLHGDGRIGDRCGKVD